MSNATSLAVRPGLAARFHRSMHLEHADLVRLRWLAIVGLLVLNVADLVLTRRLLGMGGVEANPVMAPLIGGGWGVLIKVALPVAVGVRCLRAPLTRGLVLALCWVCVLYLGVVLWNAQLLSDPALLG